jgi:hypothetical protein
LFIIIYIWGSGTYNPLLAGQEIYYSSCFLLSGKRYFNSTSLNQNNKNSNNNDNNNNDNNNNNKYGPDNVTPLNSYVQQMITGLILSDGTLVKKYQGGGTYFQMAQSIIFKSFIFYVHSLFFTAGFCNMIAPTLKTTNIKGKEYSYYSFNTKSLTDFNKLRELWYPQGIKIIPLNIEELLTPIAIAYWWMGDGGWTNNGVHFATHSYTESEVQLLKSVLTNRYGFKCSIHSNNRIYIYSSSVPAKVDLVRPYFVESMLYKIDKSYSRPTL